MSIFEKHVEQDRIAEGWLCEPLTDKDVETGGPKALRWRQVICEVSLALPPHLSEFLRLRQEVGNVRYWCGPVAGKYAAAGLPCPSRLTLHRMWKTIVNETVRLALKEGLL